MSPFPSLRAAAVTAVAALAILAPSAVASPFAKGPDPTASVIASTVGPYEIGAEKVAASASPQFGNATIWFPKAPAGETFGAVALSPGFLADGTTMWWLARRLATQGFVTIVLQPNSIFEEPAARGKELLATLEYLTTKSRARTRVDASRLAVVGHSMGGGGTLEAAKRNLALKAAVAIFPWDRQTDFQMVQTPTLVIGSRPDWIAPIAKHAVPMYRSLAPSLPKAYLELNVDHAQPIVPVTEISRAATNWLKRFVDDDARYTETLCPSIAGVKTKTVTKYLSTCGAGPLGSAAEAPADR